MIICYLFGGLWTKWLLLKCLEREWEKELFCLSRPVPCSFCTSETGGLVIGCSIHFYEEMYWKSRRLFSKRSEIHFWDSETADEMHFLLQRQRMYQHVGLKLYQLAIPVGQLRQERTSTSWPTLCAIRQKTYPHFALVVETFYLPFLFYDKNVHLMVKSCTTPTLRHGVSRKMASIFC